MSAAEGSLSYVKIWYVLITLLVIGVAVAFLPIGKPLAIGCIFAAAFAKAVLVVRHYMHLKSESLLIYVIAGIPLLLLIFMVIAFIPDVVYNR